MTKDVNVKDPIPVLSEKISRGGDLAWTSGKKHLAPFFQMAVGFLIDISRIALDIFAFAQSGQTGFIGDADMVYRVIFFHGGSADDAFLIEHPSCQQRENPSAGTDRPDGIFCSCRITVRFRSIFGITCPYTS